MKIFRDLSIAGVIALAGVLACTLAYPQLIMGNTITQSFVFHVTPGIAPAFYVAASGGSDSNPGTLAQPFATLGACQTAMRGGSTKTCYIRAGTYTLTTAIDDGSCLTTGAHGEHVSLTSADNGETWSYYPPDGVGTAVLDGGSTVGQSGSTTGGANGIGCAFAGSVSNLTIIGLQIQRFIWAGMWGSTDNGLIFKWNEVKNLTGAAFDAGGVAPLCGTGVQIINNYFHDLAYNGTTQIGNAQHCYDNGTISGNVFKNTCTWPAVPGGNDQDGGDCGAIYKQDIINGNGPLGTSTGGIISNNYIQDVFAAGNGAGDNPFCCSHGIYLDDSASNESITGNVIFGKMSSGIQVHGGNNVHMINNILDMDNIGGYSPVFIIYYDHSLLSGALPMTGNQFENNIVVAGMSATGQGYHGDDSPPNPMTVSNNFYKNYVGSSLTTTGNNNAGSDSNPVQPGTSPLITCWAPQLDPASVARNSPVNFPGINAGWGPPGFVMPQTGTPPSWPHSC